MGEKSKIEWCDHTFNPWIGCTKVSPGCDRCYAESLAKRYGWAQWGNFDRKRTSVANWRKPLAWARAAREALEDFDTGMLTLRPHRPRVFCASLADVFDNQVDRTWRIDLFDLIGATPELDWLLLTKRPENIEKMLPTYWSVKAHPNVWLGTTCEDQDAYDRRWPILSKIPATVHFISYEPAIGPLRINGAAVPDWLICGGESGPGYRDMQPKWENDIRKNCEQVGTSYFFKQMAGKRPIPADFPVVRQFPVAA